MPVLDRLWAVLKEVDQACMDMECDAAKYNFDKKQPLSLVRSGLEKKSGELSAGLTLTSLFAMIAAAAHSASLHLRFNKSKLACIVECCHTHYYLLFINNNFSFLLREVIISQLRAKSAKYRSLRSSF